MQSRDDDRELIDDLSGWFESQNVKGAQGIAIMVELCGTTIGKSARSLDELHHAIGMMHQQLVVHAYHHFKDAAR